MRLLKFLGVFLGTLIIVLLAVFGFGHKTLFTLIKNQKGIKEGKQWVKKTKTVRDLPLYIAQQPSRVSISSLDIQHPDSSITYNSHSPRTMGRLSDLFVVIEYAREVENGDLSPDAPISLDKVNAYQLPFEYEGNHRDALNHFTQQKMISSQNTVTLQNLVQASVMFNDMAIADFLLFKIGIPKIDRLMDRLSLSETESPLPLSGLYITLNPYVKERSPRAYLDSLSQLPRARFDKMVIKKTRRFITQPNYHQKVTAQFRDEQGWDIKFTRQRDALAFFPKTTAANMASVMKKLQQRKLISASVSARVKKLLSWPMAIGQHQKYLSSYGGLYDNRMGMANGVNFGTSKTNESFVQAVFFDDLQIAMWFHLSNGLMHQDFAQRLIWDRQLRNDTRTATQAHNPSAKTRPHE